MTICDSALGGHKYWAEPSKHKQGDWRGFRPGKKIPWLKSQNHGCQTQRIRSNKNTLVWSHQVVIYWNLLGQSAGSFPSTATRMSHAECCSHWKWWTQIQPMRAGQDPSFTGFLWKTADRMEHLISATGWYQRIPFPPSEPNVGCIVSIPRHGEWRTLADSGSVLQSGYTNSWPPPGQRLVKWEPKRCQPKQRPVRVGLRKNSTGNLRALLCFQKGRFFWCFWDSPP